MQVTKGTWHMCEQCVAGSLSSSHALEPGNEANAVCIMGYTMLTITWCISECCVLSGLDFDAAGDSVVHCLL